VRYSSSVPPVPTPGGEAMPPNAPNQARLRAGDTSGPEWQLEYAGPQATTLRYLELVSLTTATLSILGSPVLAHLGYGGVFVSEEHGGAAMSRADAAVLFESLAYGDVPVAAYFTIHNMVRACCSALVTSAGLTTECAGRPRARSIRL